jgi:hypothetical protein
MTSWGAVLLVSLLTAIAAYYITPPPRSSALEKR